MVCTKNKIHIKYKILLLVLPPKDEPRALSSRDQSVNYTSLKNLKSLLKRLFYISHTSRNYILTYPCKCLSQKSITKRTFCLCTNYINGLRTSSLRNSRLCCIYLIMRAGYPTLTQRGRGVGFLLDWLHSLKQFFINLSYHILVASLTLMALF